MYIFVYICNLIHMLDIYISSIYAYAHHIHKLDLFSEAVDGEALERVQGCLHTATH
jgi:hypothetical protein